MTLSRTLMQSSTRVTDGVLHDIAPHIINLEYLYLVGCPKVTHEGLSAALSGIYKGIVGLGMEGLSTAFVGYFPSPMIS